MRHERYNFVQDPYLDRKSLRILNYHGNGFDYRLEIVKTLSDKNAQKTMQLLNCVFPEGSPLDIMYESGICTEEKSIFQSAICYMKIYGLFMIPKRIYRVKVKISYLGENSSSSKFELHYAKMMSEYIICCMITETQGHFMTV